MERISVAGPWITRKEIEYVTDAVTSAWYKEHATYHNRFQTAFADYVGRRYALALPSCTSALHLSLLSVDLKPGDEVIVPDITWIASAAPISYVGATPVFADIDSQTWCLSAASFEENISPKTRAVIVVDLYGNMPDMDAILEIAERHGICVIEDAAQAVGSEFGGKKAGTFGLASTFSFHGTKTMTTGEGGMLVTDDKSFRDRCFFLGDHGRVPGEKMFWNSEVAHKYKMSNMQAALGLAQLERIEELVARKREIFNWYKQRLGEVKVLTLNYEAPGVRNTYWMVTAIMDPDLGICKENLMKEMIKNNIDTRPFFYPLSSLPAYAETPQAKKFKAQNVNTYRISPYGINLPSGYNMTRDKVEYVCHCLIKAVSQ